MSLNFLKIFEVPCIDVTEFCKAMTEYSLAGVLLHVYMDYDI